MPAGFIDDLVVAGRLLRGLPRYLRHGLTVEASRAILGQRLARREDDFLALACRAVFASARSPYRALLDLAGCRYGDLERLVRREGLAEALRILYRAGVYLTVDEFKGRRPIVRGRTTIRVDPRSLRNPLATPSLWGRTSGSRGTRPAIPWGLDSVRDRAVNLCLTLHARGGAGWHTAVWTARGLVPVLWYSACAGPATRWFRQVDPVTAGLAVRDRWSATALIWAGRVAGVPVPRAEHVPVDAPLPVARWMAQTLRRGEVPHLWTFPSSAVRLCQAAEAAGLDLAGARLTLTGEPITGARLAVVRGVGAEAMPDYGSADSGGSIAQGCLAPAAPDDVHLFDDLNVLIQADAPPFPAGALLVSSLRPTVPLVLLNVSMGDAATVTARPCGCPLEALGWRTHLHTIRSYEKLTAGGMTFVDSDVIWILEEVLPRRFGGGPTDYRLVEDEARDGRAQVRLLVHASVGPFDPEAVAEAFLSALGAGSGTALAMATQWRQGGVLRVEPEPPGRAWGGKILHLRAATGEERAHPSR